MIVVIIKIQKVFLVTEVINYNITSVRSLLYIVLYRNVILLFYLIDFFMLPNYDFLIKTLNKNGCKSSDSPISDTLIYATNLKPIRK